MSLQSDTEALLRSNDDILSTMKWTRTNPIVRWHGVQVDPEYSFIMALHLQNCIFGPHTIKGLVLPPRLQKLYLDGNRLEAEGVASLQLPHGLTELYLDMNNLGSAGAQALRLPPTLQTLSLYGNAIYDDGIQGLDLPDGLLHLHLGDNQLTGKAFSGVKLPSFLTVLDLFLNPLGDEGIEDWILPYGLEALYMNKTDIGVKGARSLKLPPSLCYLNIEYTKIDIEKEYLLELTLPPKISVLITKYDEKTNRTVLEHATSKIGIRKYFKIKSQFDVRQCRPLWFEMCRGILCGQSEVPPVFAFLRTKYGCCNIRQKIIQFSNPWNYN